MFEKIIRWSDGDPFVSCLELLYCHFECSKSYWIELQLGAQRSQMGPGVRHPYVRTWGLSEANLLHWSSCDIVSTFRRLGNCAPSPSSLRPWLLRAATRPTKSCSNQRHTGTFRSGPPPAGGPVVPSPFEIRVPHFTFGPPVAASIQ